MKLFSKHTLTIMSLLVAVGGFSSTAQARDNIFFESPIVNVGFSGKRFGNFRSRNSFNRGFRGSSRGFNRGFRSSNRGFRSFNRGFRSFNNRFNKSYKKGFNRGFSSFNRGFSSFNGGFKRGFSSSKKVYNSSPYYKKSYSGNSRIVNRSSVKHGSCSLAGFSQSIDHSRSCYQHNGHYHCE